MKEGSHSIWQELNFILPVDNEELSLEVRRLLNTFLIPALTGSMTQIRRDSFTILLTVIIEKQKMQIGLVCHMKHFMDNLSEIVRAFFSGKEDELISHIDNSRKFVKKAEFHISQGKYIPHTISLRDGAFSLKKRDFSIEISRCTTSDVLVALAALANGCPLIIEQNGPLGFRDTLLIEYLDRAQLEEKFSTRDFQCLNEDPESWFLASSTQEMSNDRI